MFIRISDTRYAEWQPGTRTIGINEYDTFLNQSDIVYVGWVETDVISFGYDKPDNSTTQIEALDALITRLIDDGMMRHPAGRGRIDVDLCGDCIAFDANGTVGDDPDYTPDKPPMALLGGYLIGPNETDHICEGHFSWSPCDGCGTKLGGTRYCYVAVPK